MLNRDFRVGQRIKCILANESNHKTVGLVGTVLGKENGIMGVEFPERVSYHDSSSCGTRGKMEYCWNFLLSEENFTSIGSPREEIE